MAYNDGRCEVSRPVNSCVEPTRDVPEVQRALSDLRCVVERYEHLVNLFHDRLYSIVIPAPSIGADIDKEHGYSVGLAVAIDEARRKLRDITDSLEGLYQRIEL